MRKLVLRLVIVLSLSISVLAHAESERWYINLNEPLEQLDGDIQSVVTAADGTHVYLTRRRQSTNVYLSITKSSPNGQELWSHQLHNLENTCGLAVSSSGDVWGLASVAANAAPTIAGAVLNGYPTDKPSTAVFKLSSDGLPIFSRPIQALDDSRVSCGGNVIDITANNEVWVAPSLQPSAHAIQFPSLSILATTEDAQLNQWEDSTGSAVIAKLAVDGEVEYLSYMPSSEAGTFIQMYGY